MNQTSEMSILVGPTTVAFLKEICPEGTEIKTGDTKLIWNKSNQDEVDAAKGVFEKLVKKGYRGFRVNDKGEGGESLDRFDPQTEKMVMIPRIAGGC